MNQHRDLEIIETPYGVRKRIEVILDWLESDTKIKQVLDFGCGTGEQITYPLAVAGFNVLGLDSHAPSIEQARCRYSIQGLRFGVADVSTLYSEQHSFDAIVCSEVLEHLDRPEELLSVFYRILSRHGVLIVTVPNGRGSYERLMSLQKRLGKLRLYKRLKQLCGVSTRPPFDPGFLNMDSQHVQFFRLRDLTNLFHSIGFDIVEQRARTLFCGPYVDIAFQCIPFRQLFIHLNATVVDRLPIHWAADWMFLLKKQE